MSSILFYQNETAAHLIPALQKLQGQLKDIKGHHNLAHQANWESKTDKLVEKNLVKKRVQEMRAQQKRNLEQRKARLAALLAAEDRIYEKEFNDNLETPEQVRDKMWHRL